MKCKGICFQIFTTCIAEQRYQEREMKWVKLIGYLRFPNSGSVKGQILAVSLRERDHSLTPCTHFSFCCKVLLVFQIRTSENKAKVLTLINLCSVSLLLLAVLPFVSFVLRNLGHTSFCSIFIPNSFLRDHTLGTISGVRNWTCVSLLQGN